jgi:DeoR family glycerol-3-phosphate regulon repressor
VKQTQRHIKIIQTLKNQGFIATEQLVEQLKVSPQTIRRDLNQLAENNQIQRHHGGASLLGNSVVNDSYANRKIKHQAEKQQIAHQLAAHIANGSSLFLDIGTTAETIAQALLKHRDLRVVTNNIHVAKLLMGNSDFEVLLAGGVVRSRDGGIVGEATIDFIRQFRLDYGIITVSGIDLDGSLLDFDYHEVRITQAIIANSRTVILAADHSKFGRNAMINIGNIAQVDHFYTDRALPQDIASIVQKENIQLRLCPALNSL